MPERPALRVNQVGYLRRGPKQATLVTDAVEPVPFAVLDAQGARLLEGRSRPWPVRPEPTSGLAVHVLDFTALEAAGGGMRLLASGQRSHPFDVGDHLYRQLADHALGFFYLMRSGIAVDEERAPGYRRPAGHVGRPPNRGDTAVPAWSGPPATQLYPGWRQPGRFDVSGGWYDAGDFGKYVPSGAIAAWQLLSTVTMLERSRPSAERDRFAADVLEEVRWQLDWLLRMQVPSGEPLAGMAFHRVHGTSWSPIPGWPHEDPTERVLHRPSTTATLQLAAAAAHAARLFGSHDRAYAARLLVAARTAYAAADRNPTLLAPDDHARFGGGPYGDGDPTDDAYWAAAELWLITREEDYLRDLVASPAHEQPAYDPAGFDFDRVSGPAHLDLALAGGQLPDHDRIVAGLREGADRLLDVQARQPWGQPYAPPEGWAWGSNGRLLNNLVVLAVAHLVTGDARYRSGAASGVDYLFGRNALGQSYVTGYGIDDTQHQRTRQFGRDLDEALPPPPPGALAGGANSQPSPDFPYDRRLVGRPPQCCYLDEPTSEVTNDVCIRWNAPLVWVAAYLDGQQL